jgi:hypothetical protein
MIISLIVGTRVRILNRPDLPSDTGTIANPVNGRRAPGFATVAIDRYAPRGKNPKGRRLTPRLDLLPLSKLEVIPAEAEATS